jgi:alkaline phosphatase
MSLSRRRLLEGGLGVAGLSAIGSPSFAGSRSAAYQAVKPTGAKPKNIIFCVTDGTAMSVITMADMFQQMAQGRRGYWPTLLDQEYAVSGYQETRSLSSLVTDSSAASSTWGSGRRIWNGQVNQYPDGTLLRPLTSIVKEAGMRVGLVTTTTVTHATPAGFAVNCVQRDLEPLIAEKYLKSGVDVLMGGGDKFFSPGLRKDKKDLYGDFAKAGFKVVKTKQELVAVPGNAARPNKLLGVFSNGHLPYSVDQATDATLKASTPTLAEMTKAALANLKGSLKGFLLQIEGGRVDHGAHGNDLAATLYDYMAFEDALKAAVEFALNDKETLVIVTADHATGGPSLNGAGEEYFDSTAGLMTVAGMKGSYGTLLKAAGEKPTPDSLRDAVKATLGITLTPAEAAAVASAAAGQSPFAVSEFHGTAAGTLAMILGNHSKVTWTGPNHTSDHVLVTAVGPGSEAVTGLTPNYKFFDLMLAAKGLKWENPAQMDFATAKRHYEKLEVSLLSDRERREQYLSLA